MSVVGERAVVDAELVDVAAAIVVVGAFDAGGADDAASAGRTGRGSASKMPVAGFVGGELAVDVEADAGGLVPGEGEVDPLVRLGEAGQRVGDAGAAEVDVGDEGVEAVAVVVDAEPDHVPAGVVAVADAEDGELGLVDGVAAAPVEAERAALGVDVSGGPVGPELVVAALEVVAFCTAGENLDVGEEVRGGLAAGEVGVEAVLAGKIKEQAGVLRRGSRRGGLTGLRQQGTRTHTQNQQGTNKQTHRGLRFCRKIPTREFSSFWSDQCKPAATDVAGIRVRSS